MQEMLRKAIQKNKRDRVRRIRQTAVLSVLSVLVCVIVFNQLSMVAIPMEDVTDSALAEHTHTAACYNDATHDAENEAYGQAMLSGANDSTVDSGVSLQATQLLNNSMSSNSTSSLQADDPASQADESDAAEPTDLIEYISGKAGATYTITLSDQDNKVITDGTLIAGAPYTFSLAVASDNGLAAGTYVYTLPEGTTVTQQQNGDLMLKNNGTEVKVGTWSFGTNGVLTIVLDDIIKEYTKVSLSAYTSVSFSETEEPVEFTETIKFDVKLPDANWQQDTSLAKMTRDINDPTKIKWRIKIECGMNSKLLGETITDKITTTDTLYFSQDDIESGIYLEAIYYENPNDKTNAQTHSCKITLGEYGLTWDSDSWSFTMPETITCTRAHTGCPSTIELGEDAYWLYNIEYTTTKKTEGLTGFVAFTNDATVGGKTVTQTTSENVSGVPAGIQKTGEYDEDDEVFRWTITSTIPAWDGTTSANAKWEFVDTLRVYSTGLGTIYYDNPLNGAFCTITTMNGTSYTVPVVGKNTEAHTQVMNAGKDEYVLTYGHSTNDGVKAKWTGSLYKKCNCTETTCGNWNSETSSCATQYNEHYCTCWTVLEDVELQLVYETNAKDAIDLYGEKTDGKGNHAYMHNFIIMNYIQYSVNEEGKKVSTTNRAGEATKTITIPSLFNKTMEQEPKTDSNWIASYEILLNSALRDLTDEEVKITDEMSSTLVLIPASVRLTATDKNDVTTILQEGTDFTLENDSTNHSFTVKILHPGKYTYKLTYNAVLYIEAGTTDFSYKNAASITLRDTKFSSVITPQYASGATATGEYYSVTLIKTDASNSSNLLSGAVFGLYTQDGVRLGIYTTDDNGQFIAQTDTANGVFLFKDTPYYFQEITAPAGYILDQTEHWFYFCDKADCENCPEAPKGIIYTRIQKSTDSMTVTNEKGYVLPETGGSGIQGYILTGCVLMISSAFGMIGIRKRNKNVR